MTRETKLLIDMWDILHRECHKVVTEENYDAIKKSIKALEQEKESVLDKIFPDNATNGDMIKTIFPNLEWIDERGDAKSYILEPEHILSPKLIAFNSWWDAPYKAFEKEPFINKSCVSSEVCDHDKNKVLNKIRAEIEHLTYYWCEVNPKSVIDDVLKIIDKYKAESEE